MSVCPIVEGMSAAGRAAMPTFHNAFECYQYHWHWRVDAGTDFVHRQRTVRDLMRNAYPFGAFLRREANSMASLF